VIHDVNTKCVANFQPLFHMPTYQQLPGIEYGQTQLLVSVI